MEGSRGWREVREIYPDRLQGCQAGGKENDPSEDVLMPFNSPPESHPKATRLQRSLLANDIHLSSSSLGLDYTIRNSSSS